MVNKIMAPSSTCTHLQNVTEYSLGEICKSKEGQTCAQCSCSGPNLWICLHQSCLEIGCSEGYNDHSTFHFKCMNSHCIHMNLSTQRVWCYMCENEVFLSVRESFHERRNSLDYENNGDTTDSEDQCEDGTSPRGLVGLQNIGNTCYMNAALQALSNTPALTGFFLDCSAAVEMNQNCKPGLSRSYQRLVKDIWHKKSRGYVVPSGILYGIRNVHPMFRGYQQHDTQEFLRCFMDQLHEELKQVSPQEQNQNQKHQTNSIDIDDISANSSPCPSPTPSQSEGEYETCDSGVSEQSSLSDESPPNNSANNTVSYKKRQSRSPSPPQDRLRSKLTVVNRTTPAVDVHKQTTHSIISDIFDGKLLSSVQCLTCDRVSTRVETFQDLSLPIPGRDHLAVLHQSQGHHGPSQPSGATCTDAVYQANQEGWVWWIWGWLRSWFWGPAVTLHDCLAAFFSADELKGDNMYSCEKCNKLRNGVKYSRVMDLPEMLCIHLKRFRHELMYSSKISSPVEFPLSGLDMRPYLHKECVSEVSTYELSAVICHHGTAGGGHYTTMAKHNHTGLWFEFDDQFVTQVTSESVLNCEAYVLFYRKCSSNMNTIRQKAAELVDSVQATDLRFYVSKQWLNRFNTCAEPGPIDNWSFLCPHGGIPPSKVTLAPRLAVALSQPLWDYLYGVFGGGPACNQLFECETCQHAMEILTKRQTYELDTFKKLHQDFQNDLPSTIYALSMVWFRRWQSFVRGNSGAEPPGPIDNHSIYAGVNIVRPGSDYAQLNKDLWRFFSDIYGGGPEIIIRSGEDIITIGTAHREEEINPSLNETVVEVKHDTFPNSIHATRSVENTKSGVTEEDNSAPAVHKTQSLQNIPRVTDSIPEFVIPTRSKSKSPRGCASITESLSCTVSGIKEKTKLYNGDVRSSTDSKELSATAESDSEITPLIHKLNSDLNITTTGTTVSSSRANLVTSNGTYGNNVDRRMDNNKSSKRNKNRRKDKKLSPKESGDQASRKLGGGYRFRAFWYIKYPILQRG